MLQNNNQEQIFRDWVKKSKYEDLVKSFNNSCLEKKRIIQEELNLRLRNQFIESVDENNYYQFNSEQLEVAFYSLLSRYCRSLNYSEEIIKESNLIQLINMIYHKTEEYKQAQQKIENYINESNQQLFNFCFDGPYCPKITPESLERRLNRKLP